MFLDFVFTFTPWVILILPLFYYVVPYFQSYAIRKFPAPFPAAFTNFWLMYQCRRGRRFQAVHNAHQKYGTIVRIAPNHISIAHPDAVPIVYGHGNGFLKSDFYDAFVSIQRGLFNTRDRAEHTRKRKTVSHTFSARSIGKFEKYMHANIDELVKQWDRISANAHGRYAHIDALHWFNYLAFDIIGDLAFGAPFGMLAKGKDIAEVRKTPDSPPTYAPAVQVLNRRGEVSATLGCLPQLKPYAKNLPDPFFRNGLEAVENLAGIAVARANYRLDAAERGEDQRDDLLARLMEGRDSKGEKMGRAELTAEALTQLIAGSDTTSNTSCAILFWCLKTPGVMKKLQAELDATLPSAEPPLFHQVKDLPYLNAVINETLRIHSTSSLGLPRVVPPGGSGVTILGEYFPPGTVLSVPSYTLHRDKSVWGSDAEEFKPERWLPSSNSTIPTPPTEKAEKISDDTTEQTITDATTALSGLTELQKASFIPFSVGPRACVGRNVAEMELRIIVATVARRYEFELYEDVLETREGFLRKPLRCLVGLKKRGGT